MCGHASRPGSALGLRIEDQVRFCADDFVGMGHHHDPVFRSLFTTVDFEYGCAPVCTIANRLIYLPHGRSVAPAEVRLNAKPNRLSLRAEGASKRVRQRSMG